MSGRLVLVLITLFSAIAVAKPKPWPTKSLHNDITSGFSPSWYFGTEDDTPEKDHTSKYPCGGPERHAIIKALDRFVGYGTGNDMPDIKVTNDEMFLHVGGAIGWQAADSYSTDDDGDRNTDPITAHWVIDKDTEIHISIIRTPYAQRYGAADEPKTRPVHRMAVSIVKYLGTPKYCYERYTADALVKEVLK